MAIFQARVDIMLRHEINDPQGLAIANGLAELGFDEVQSVRAGKRIDLTLESDDIGSAQHRVSAMADKLLANLTIEDYTVSVTLVD